MPTTCQKCEKVKRDAEKKAVRDHAEKLQREAKSQSHLKKVAEVQEEIDKLTQSMKDARHDSEQASILRQKQKDLAALKELANKPKPNPAPATYNPTTISSAPNPDMNASVPSRTPKHAGKPKLQEHLKSTLGHNTSVRTLYLTNMADSKTPTI